MLVKVAAFVIPLGFDTLAVAVALGLRGVAPLRPALAFALFEMGMPIVGLLLGRLIGARFETSAGIAGGIVLLAVSAYMVKEAREDEDEAASLSFSSPRTAALAGFAISLDELAVGFPMGTTGLPILPTLAAIGVQAFVVTFFGIRIGSRLSAAFGRRTSKIAGFAAAAAFALLGTYFIVWRFAGLPGA